MIHSARNSARGRDRSHEMKGLQPSLWEQGLPAQEKPPAKLVDIYFILRKIYDPLYQYDTYKNDYIDYTKDRCISININTQEEKEKYKE